LAKLGSPEINVIVNEVDFILNKKKCEAKTPFGRVKELFYKGETYSARLVEAMKATAEKMSD
jgi:hypothetical protein